MKSGEIGVEKLVPLLNSIAEKRHHEASENKDLQSKYKSINISLPFYIHFFSGGVAGTIGAIITCPLEVVKTRFQSSHYKTASSIDAPRFSISPFRTVMYHLKGTFEALRLIYKNEGVLALWRGVGTTIIGVMPSRAIYFACYNKGKYIFSELNESKESSLVHLAAAASAGIVTATVTNPIWMIKTRLQLQQSNLKTKQTSDMIQYRNAWHCLNAVIRNEGGLALYQGLSASYLGVLEGTLQWVIYEKLKRVVFEYKTRANESHALAYKVTERNPKDWLDYFLIAASSKLIACIATYPHEVLRTRLRQGVTQGGHSKYSGLIQATKLIYREEGLAAFYSGMTAHLLRVVPNSAIMFFCYEALVYAFIHSTASKENYNTHS